MNYRLPNTHTHCNQNVSINARKAFLFFKDIRCSRTEESSFPASERYQKAGFLYS